MSGDGHAANANTRVDVYFLPEYFANSAQAGKSHVGVPRRKIGTLNGSKDLEGAVRIFAREPGAYYAELRAGRDVIDSGVFPVKARTQPIELDAGGALNDEAPPLSSDARLDRLEQMFVDLIEAQSNRDAPDFGGDREITDEDDDEERDMRRARRRRRRLAARPREVERPRGLVAQMKELTDAAEVVETFKKKHAPEPERASNPATTISDEDRALMLILNNKQVRDRVSSAVAGLVDGDNVPQRHWLADIVSTMMEHGDKFAPLLTGLMMRVAPPATQPQAPQGIATPQSSQSAEQANAEQTPFEVALSAALDSAFDDLKRNASVANSARDYVALYADFPEGTPILDSVLGTASVILLQQVATMRPELALLPTDTGAVEWLDRLKAAVTKRRKRQSSNASKSEPDAASG